MLKAEGWKRIVAYLIDSFIINVMLRIIFIIIGTKYKYPFTITYPLSFDYFSHLILLFVFSSLFIIIIYYCLIPIIWDSQTIGRALFRIKVVKKDNQEMKFSDFLLRDLLGLNIIVYILTLFCFLGPIINAVMLFGDNQTTIQDEIANSKMVDLSINVTVDRPKELFNQENNSEYSDFYDDDF